MKNKKLYLLILVVLLQIFTPIVAIAKKNYDLKDAPVYKVSVNGYDPYDILRGRYIQLRPEIEINIYTDKKYIEKDYNGYISVIDTTDYTEKEKEDLNYFEELDLSKYYINENLADSAEKFIRDNPDNDLYLEVQILKGKYKVLGMYVVLDNGEISTIEEIGETYDS
ncbi:MAG: GDYXXLXY domain-containing protein [Lachnospirales bacterium]